MATVLQRKRARSPSWFELLGSRSTPRCGKLVLLRGTVGCGKSTAATRIRNVVEARGDRCFVASVDRFVRLGLPRHVAIQRLREELRDCVEQWQREPGEQASCLVVVIDACNERAGVTDVFGVDFRGWRCFELWPNLDRDDLAGYFAWSLRNVLTRRAPTPQDSFALHPGAPSSRDVCIDVHHKKCSALFARDMHLWDLDAATPQSLQAQAERYARRSVRDFAWPEGL